MVVDIYQVLVVAYGNVPKLKHIYNIYMIKSNLSRCHSKFYLNFYFSGIDKFQLLLYNND